MGYRRQRKTFRLQFSGELEGLEIQVQSIGLGRLLDLGDQADRLRAGAGLSGVRELIELFVERITYWNLEDETGEPIKPSVDAFLDQDVDFCSAAILAWVDSMTSVSASLGKASTSGPSLAPANFPMEAL